MRDRAIAFTCEGGLHQTLYQAVVQCELGLGSNQGLID